MQLKVQSLHWWLPSQLRAALGRVDCLGGICGTWYIWYTISIIYARCTWFMYWVPRMLLYIHIVHMVDDTVLPWL